MRHIIVLALLAWTAPAFADARGGNVYAAHCARCHVVGQGQPLAQKNQSFIDITLAARQHDQKWLVQFMQAPTSVNVDSACQSKVGPADAAALYGFLKKRLKQPAPEDIDTRNHSVRLHVGKVPPQTEAPVAQPLPGPKPATMVHR